MSATPLVTVILTSYNHGRFIGQALQSVLDQSVDDLEVLCVDDASNDETSACLAKFADPRLWIITSRLNRGLHQRNFALRQARGDYVAFQNSDDVWLPGKLATQVEFLQANPECGACFTAVELCDDAGNPCPSDPDYGSVFKVEQHDRWQWLRRFYHSGNCLALPSAVVRASALGRTELMDPSLFQVSDWDLWVQIAAVADLYVIADPLTMVRIGNGGRNLSAPSAGAHNRATHETLEILRRYARPPILGQINQIFGDEMEPATAADRSSESSTLVRLGLMATSSRVRHHRLAGIEFLRAGLRSADLHGGLSQETRSRAAHRLFLISGELDAQIPQSRPTKVEWVDLTVQLFWRFEGGSFSEEQSTIANCSVSTSPIRIPLSVPPSRRPVDAIRLDLANRPVSLLLHKLTLFNSQREVIWQMPSTSPAAFEMSGMHCSCPASGSGLLIQTLDDDPQWILPLSPAICGALSDGGTLDIVVQGFFTFPH
jgi:hypothetical protein